MCLYSGVAVYGLDSLISERCAYTRVWQCMDWILLYQNDVLILGCGSVWIGFSYIRTMCLYSGVAVCSDINYHKQNTQAGAVVQRLRAGLLITGSLVRTHSGASFVINFASLSPASAWPSLA